MPDGLARARRRRALAQTRAQIADLRSELLPDPRCAGGPISGAAAAGERQQLRTAAPSLPEPEPEPRPRPQPQPRQHQQPPQPPQQRQPPGVRSRAPAPAPGAPREPGGAVDPPLAFAPSETIGALSRCLTPPICSRALIARAVAAATIISLRLELGLSKELVRPGARRGSPRKPQKQNFQKAAGSPAASPPSEPAFGALWLDRRELAGGAVEGAAVISSPVAVTSPRAAPLAPLCFAPR